ncbi:MAG: hypothetical protein NTV81_03295 [Candidatus Komeilibacteria bacterium]|nr:hypothetical protein [Candidatus Komeilibacteria bacterium]
MSEQIQTTKLEILEQTPNQVQVALPNGEKLSLPLSLFPATSTQANSCFLTISQVPNQEVVSKELAQNLLNELINAPLTSKE